MMAVMAEEKPDIERTRAELSAWVTNLDQAIADLRCVIAQEESEQHQ